jgi:hypothetical protein
MLKEFDGAVMRRAIHGLVLLGWTHFDRISAPPFDVIRKRASRFISGQGKEVVGERDAAAKPTDEEKWFLYLASPMVDDKGPAAAYRLVHSIMRRTPDLWIEPLEIRVIGMNDSLTEAALEAIKPKVPNSPYAIKNPKPYPGMTVLRGETLGGLSVDGAYIYPPLQQSAPV